MKAREKILSIVCLVFFFLVSQAFSAALEGESVSPMAWEGFANTFYGLGAGHSTFDDDDYDTFIGREAGYNNTTGYDNVFLGYRAGFYNTTGNYNTFLGYGAGIRNTTGYSNTFVGFGAANENTTGENNAFIGNLAGYFNTTGNRNTFLGMGAGYSNSIGNWNTFLGAEAGRGNTGYANTIIGDAAGYASSTGSNNTFLGNTAGRNNSGEGNVFLGYAAGENETGSNRLCIDNSNTSTPLIYGQFDYRRLTVNGNLEVIGPNNGLVRLSNVTADSTTKVARMVVRHYNNAEEPLYLFGAASTASDNFVAFGGGATIGNAATQIDLYTAPNTTTLAGTARVTIKGNGFVGIGTQSPTQPLQMASGAHVTAGGVWTNASSREYKEEIENLTSEEALEAIRDLNPVKFAYKTDRTDRHVGFVAEEVPDLVATKDRKGLSPMDIVAVLTRVVQDQQKTISDLSEKVGNLERELRLRDRTE
jgi:hypothetical protein